MHDQRPGVSRRAGLTRAARLARRAMLMMAAVLALGGIAPALASASSPEWYESGNPIFKSTAVKWTGNLEILDNFASGFSANIRCSDSGTGAVGSKGAGEQTSWTFTSCVTGGESGLNVCSSERTVELGTGFPTKTQLALVEGKILNTINFPTETPYFRWKCTGLGGTHFEGECPAWPSPTLENLTEPAGVLSKLFAERQTCKTNDGVESRLHSNQTILLKSGARLQVK
jgi:hypothetical protein